MLFLILLWIFGCCFGSFILVISLRIPLNQSIIRPRSHCEHCKTTLPILSLIPVFSYIIQKGRCLICQSVIPFYYLLIEFSTGVLVVFSFFLFKSQPLELLIAWTLIFFGLIFSLTDLFYFILPNSLMLLFLVIILLECWYLDDFNWFHSALNSIFILFLLLSISFVTHEGLGGGDIKFYFVLSWLLGFQGILVAIIISCFFALIAIFISRKRLFFSLNDKLPFAPFISLGAFLVFCFQRY